MLPLRARYLLILVGKPFTGRSDALRYLEMAKGFHGYALERILSRHLELPGSPQPQGRALRRVAAEARQGCRDNGVVARWLLNDIRRRHLERTETWRPPPRIVITGLNHPAELDVLTAFSRSAVFRIQLEDEVRCERAVASGLLPREHGIVRVKGVTTRRFVAAVDDTSRDGDPSHVDRPDDLMQAAACTSRKRGSAVIAAAQYRDSGLTPVLKKLDDFVDTLEKTFPSSQF